jgi:hypothetical protein
LTSSSFLSLSSKVLGSMLGNSFSSSGNRSSRNGISWQGRQGEGAEAVHREHGHTMSQTS